MQTQSKSFSPRLQERLAAVERRNWGLCVLVLVAVVMATAGLFYQSLSAIFGGQTSIQIRAEIATQLLLGLVLLVLLLIAYLIQKLIELRDLRMRSILEAWNFELAHNHLLIDPLTQVLNRHAVEEILAKEITRVQQRQSTMVFLYVDVDGLKMVNTRFGHLSGDMVLTAVGELLKCVRGSDYVFRWGGDEFLVALMDTDTNGGEIVKSRILQRVEEWNRRSLLSGYRLTLSIGIQPFDPTQTFDQAMAQADAKMYVEKKGAFAINCW